MLCIISSTSFTSTVEKSWENMRFHSKMAWPPATYEVISPYHSKYSKLVSKFAQRINEQLQKTSSALRFIVYKKKNQKALLALANATVSKTFQASSWRKLRKDLAPKFAQNNSFGNACFAGYATFMTNHFTVEWLTRG